MWKRTFIRLLFVTVVVTTGILVFAAAGRKTVDSNTECTNAEEKCTQKEDNADGDFLIWETMSRTVLSAIQD